MQCLHIGKQLKITKKITKKPQCRVRSFLPVKSFAFFPTTVTPFPVFTTLFSAASFCLLTPPIPFTLENLSTPLSSASRDFFRAFRSFVRSARFSSGVNSLRARRSEAEGAKTSSGASIADADLLVGNADSRLVAATLETVDIVALGCKKACLASR